MIPTLTDYQTGEAIRPATHGEHLRSREAERENGTGAFLLDGRSVFVAGDFAGEPTAPTRLFRITNPASGVNLGTYAGATKARALDNYAVTAGYASFADACEVTGDDPEDDAGLVVTEITETAAVPHTPGPWTREDMGTNRPIYAGNVCVATAWGGVGSGPDDETASNALLIATAPDLLAALRSIADIPKQGEPEEPGSEYRQDWHDHDGGERAIKALHDAIDRARAAIRLAGGAL